MAILIVKIKYQNFYEYIIMRYSAIILPIDFVVQYYI